MSSPDFWSRLRKARLPRVLLAYVAGSWLVLQVVDILVEALELPSWVTPVAILLLLIGLLVVTATAWVLAGGGGRGSGGTELTAWSLDLEDVAEDVRERRVPELTWSRTLLGGGLAFVLLVGIALAAGVVDEPRSRPLAGDPARPGVAVLPFRTTGPGLDVWREGVPELLATNLEGATGLRKIDPSSLFDQTGLASADGGDPEALIVAARPTGAAFAVTGSVVGHGADVRLTAQAYDLGAGRRLGTASVDGPADSLLSLVDALSVEILRGGLLPGDPELPNFDVGRVTTRSLPALRHYVEGERAYRRSQWQDAIHHFTAAVEADSTFPLALYRLSLAHQQDGSSQAAREYGARALALADRLPERERLLLKGQALRLEGDPAVIDTLAFLVARYPDDVEAWQRYGASLLRFGPVRLRDGASFRRPMTRAVELNPHFGPAYPDLIEEAFARRDSADLARWLEGYKNIDDTSDYCIGYDFAYRLRWGSDEVREEAVAALDTLHSDPLACVAISLTYDPTADDEYELVNREREERGSWTTIHGNALYNHATYLVSRGRFRESMDYVARFGSEIADASLEPEARAEWGLISAGALDPAEARPGLQAVDHPIALFWLGAIAVGEDDRATATAYADSLIRLAEAADDPRAASDQRAFAGTIRGLVALAAGRPDEAADMLEAALPGLPIQRVGHAAQYRARYLLAEAYLEGGEPAEAMRVADSFTYIARDYRTHVELLKARASEQLGDREAARRHYANVVEWWEDADPEIQALREAAREALDRLAGEG